MGNAERFRGECSALCDRTKRTGGLTCERMSRYLGKSAAEATSLSSYIPKWTSLEFRCAGPRTIGWFVDPLPPIDVQEETTYLSSSQGEDDSSSQLLVSYVPANGE